MFKKFYKSFLFFLLSNVCPFKAPPPKHSALWLVSGDFINPFDWLSAESLGLVPHKSLFYLFIIYFIFILFFFAGIFDLGIP